MAKKKKFDCYKCEHRGGVAGSAHSCCEHPKIAHLVKNPFGEILATFASVRRVHPIMAGDEKLNVKGNLHGIKMGWFNWPYNFDPVWLENCDGFKKEGDK